MAGTSPAMTRGYDLTTLFVVAGLDPAIHLPEESFLRWMRGSSPRMTIPRGAI
jgi:hypothetical protein